MAVSWHANGLELLLTIFFHTHERVRLYFWTFRKAWTRSDDDAIPAGFSFVGQWYMASKIRDALGGFAVGVLGRIFAIMFPNASQTVFGELQAVLGSYYV